MGQCLPAVLGTGNIFPAKTYFKNILVMLITQEHLEGVAQEGYTSSNSKALAIVNRRSSRIIIDRTHGVQTFVPYKLSFEQL